MRRMGMMLGWSVGAAVVVAGAMLGGCAACAGHSGRNAVASVETATRDSATIILVRHAHKEPAPGNTDDPGLSVEGLAQAALLERVVRDAGVTRVLVSDAVRTRMTAGPSVAGIAGLSLRPGGDFRHDDQPERVAKVILDGAVPGGTTLVVSHSHHIPAVLKAMGGWTVPDYREISPEDSYRFLFVVTVHADGRKSLIRAGYPPSAK